MVGPSHSSPGHIGKSRGHAIFLKGFIYINLMRFSLFNVLTSPVGFKKNKGKTYLLFKTKFSLCLVEQRCSSEKS